MKNKTKEDIKQICTYFSEDMGGVGTCGYSLTEEQFSKLFEYIEKNFVAKGEVREMIEDIQATEIADHSLASLIEKLHKYKKSLE